MTTRRWIGLAMLLSAVALGNGIQASCGKLFKTEAATIKPVKTGWPPNFHIGVHTADIRPNWPVVIPLALLACAGLALILIPRGKSNP